MIYPEDRNDFLWDQLASIPVSEVTPPPKAGDTDDDRNDAMSEDELWAGLKVMPLSAVTTRSATPVPAPPVVAAVPDIELPPFLVIDETPGGGIQHHGADSVDEALLITERLLNNSIARSTRIFQLEEIRHRPRSPFIQRPSSRPTPLRHRFERADQL